MMIPDLDEDEDEDITLQVAAAPKSTARRLQSLEQVPPFPTRNFKNACENRRLRREQSVLPRLRASVSGERARRATTLAPCCKRAGALGEAAEVFGLPMFTIYIFVARACVHACSCVVFVRLRAFGRWQLDHDLKYAIPAGAGVDLSFLTASLVPSAMVHEDDTPWDFDSLLQEVSPLIWLKIPLSDSASMIPSQ